MTDNACANCGSYLFDWDKKQPYCSDCFKCKDCDSPPVKCLKCVAEDCEMVKSQTANKIIKMIEDESNNN